MNEYYDILEGIYSLPEMEGWEKYRRMRDLLETLCWKESADSGLQITGLAARINYVAAKYGMSAAQRNRLHNFRLASNRILNGQAEATGDIFLRDLKTLAFTVRRIGGEKIPSTLYDVLPERNDTECIFPLNTGTIKRMRVCYQYSDNEFLYVIPSDGIASEYLKIRYGVKGVNDEFDGTVAELWEYAQLNLLDIRVEEEGIYTPALIILEPDYLIDISSLAECFKEYGNHPANYNLAKLLPIENSRPLLLGNIANLFLDEWIHGNGQTDYLECMKKAFCKYALELAACEDLKERGKELQFFADCRLHFEHIREVVQNTFRQPGYCLDKEDAVLEPSYICESLGIQGRLDYMQRDMSSFIEMKSGKADEYAYKGKIEPKENNRIQMLLYMAVLEYNMGQDYRRMHPYLLYTRYPLLYPATSSRMWIKKAMNVRNRIVAAEYKVQSHHNISYTASCLAQIDSSFLNERGLQGKFWEQYLAPSIDRYKTFFGNLPPLDKAYYLSIYNFITKEWYVSKAGESSYDGKNGISSLWLSTLAHKQEQGEILYDLKIKENHASDLHKAYIVLSIPAYEVFFLPNFRPGDLVVLYERNLPQDNVTNKMIFKGSIESLNATEIKIRLRAPQRNLFLFPLQSLYAVEHDGMDTTFRFMFQGLYYFMTANRERKDLLLSRRLPDFDTFHLSQGKKFSDDFERVVRKAESAKDYLLVVGPPGTGKTSRALKQMVESFYGQADTQILLLAYTNRAVDEICKSLSAISPAVDYIRVGSELSCEETYRKYLLENKIKACSRRSDVLECIGCCRIFVGTVVSLANRPELFRLKTFQVAIIDEATQILEPQLLGLLCMKNSEGNNAVGKFILIGDPKQLPAVVLQSPADSRVTEPLLTQNEITDWRESLFERLYRFNKKNKNSHAVDMLCRQGRMHPAISQFSNMEFYEGKLEMVGLPHQLEDLQLFVNSSSSEWFSLLSKRMVFIPSCPDHSGKSAKSNRYEAEMAAKIVYELYNCYRKTFDPGKTIGVITPYRSQVALIKKEILQLGVPALNTLMVDTVERFQGSERDIIIYSFCLNYLYQLDFLPCLTQENGVSIDRKLNVALTRARKQLFIIGVPALLKQNMIYDNLLKLIE